MLNKELVKKYKLSNPHKYEEKLKRGEFDAVLGIIRGEEFPPVNPLIIKQTKRTKKSIKAKRK